MYVYATVGLFLTVLQPQEVCASPLSTVVYCIINVLRMCYFIYFNVNVLGISSLSVWHRSSMIQMVSR